MAAVRKRLGSQAEYPGARQRLMDAGKALFSERGFAATSIRQIAQQADCNLALIHHYFGSKEGLLSALVEAQMREDAPELLRAMTAAGSPKDRLRRFIEMTVDHLAKDSALLRIAHQELMHSDSPFLARLLGPIEGVLKALSAQFREQGADERLEPRMLAYLMMGAIQFFFVAYPLTARLLPAQEKARNTSLKRHLIALFVDGTSRRRASSPRARRPSLP